MRHNGERSPEEIQAEIARTRGDMDATLTALEQRFTPGQLLDQGIDYLRHSGANEFVSNLGGSVKHNPLPVALVGIGLAWLMAAGGRKPAYMEEKSATGPGAMQRASESVASAKEKLGRVGQGARQQVERVSGQPLALGAIGLAVGAVLAAAAPRTRKEDELMGEARDRLAERAKAAGEEQMKKMQPGTTASQTELPAQPPRAEISATAPAATGAASKDARLGTP